jgi:hypothetical protein
VSRLLPRSSVQNVLSVSEIVVVEGVIIVCQLVVRRRWTARC